MEIRLLGTGGADGIPALYGSDPVSRYARQHGGKDVRTRAAALIDNTLKIDLGPDTNMQMLRDGLDPRDWSALIFTHSDDDHLNVAEIQYAMFPFTELDHLPYTVYANATVLGIIRDRYPEWPMELVETRSFETFDHGPYRVTPIMARHIFEEDCHNLIFQRDGKTFLYATDTGVYFERTFEFLQDFKLDALVIECTDGVCPQGYEGHLSIDQCIGVVDRLRQQGTLGSESQVITTHHSTRGGARHCDLERLLCPHDIQPGYDGQVVRI